MTGGMSPIWMRLKMKLLQVVDLDNKSKDFASVIILDEESLD